MTRYPPLANRLDAKTTKGQPDGCWLWSGATRHFGYGTIWHNGRQIGTHRASWEVHHGPIPIGLFVLHHCDRPACVNPDHLFLGDQRANLADAESKRRARLIPGPAARIGVDDVRAIRRRHAAGESAPSLATVFGLSRSAVYRMVTRESWGWLP